MPSENAFKLSSVEEYFLKKSNRKLIYPEENIPIVEVENVMEMGKLTALRFIEWVLNNPKGNIALPTGKTPEYFIEFLKHYRKNWKTEKVQKELQQVGITSKEFPDTSQLRFFQLDEFYPFDENHSRSFVYYVRNYYLPLLNLKPENVHIIDINSRGVLKEHGLKTVFPTGKADLSLLKREPKTPLEKLQRKALEEAEQFCKEYEELIRKHGGIGFFLGGIGVDGHIAFNLRGSPHDSKTRLLTLNYETAAQVATDLGGITYSRDKATITMGLETITFNKDVVLIIMAAGEAKADVIAAAVEGTKHPDRPATVLHGLKNARMFLDGGAAKLLKARRAEDLEKDCDPKSHKFYEAVTAIALYRKKRVVDLTKEDFQAHPSGRVLLNKHGDNVFKYLDTVRDKLVSGIERGLKLPENKHILHSEPHHDDIMLSYYPIIPDLQKKNKHSFACATSGFTSVTDDYIKSIAELVSLEMLKENEKTIINEDIETVVELFVKEYKKKNLKISDHIEAIVLAISIKKIWKLSTIDEIAKVNDWILKEYFPNKPPGQQDSTQLEILKGMMREVEEVRLWRLHGFESKDIYHLRTKFYTGEFFKPPPTIEDDAKPLYELVQKLKPDLITVAFDPAGTGPDTHYKVLQITGDALRLCEDDYNPTIWGYRNIWYRFQPAEKNLLIIPVKEEMLKMLHEDFMACFSTQKTAEFPSYELDGPFSLLADKIQKEQLELMKILLGKEFFENHKDERIRTADALLFIKEMTKKEFLDDAMKLKALVECFSI